MGGLQHTFPAPDSAAYRRERVGFWGRCCVVQGGGGGVVTQNPKSKSAFCHQEKEEIKIHVDIQMVTL